MVSFNRENGELEMTHYEISYVDMPPVIADEHALKDIQEYLTPKQWDAALELAAEVAAGRTEFGAVRMGFTIVGVSGYPFHAFCRKYCLEAYREWMHAGPNAVMTDSQGFPLPEWEQ